MAGEAPPPERIRAGAPGTAASRTAPAPLPRQSRLFFGFILAALLVLIWIVFRPFVIFMVTGLFVAVLALPVDRMWEKVLRSNRLAAFATIFTVGLLLLIPLVALGFALANDAERLAGSIQSGEAQAWLDEQLSAPIVQQALDLAYPDQTPEERNATVNEAVDQGRERVIVELTDFGKRLVGALPSFMVGLVVILFVVYYVLVDGDRLKAYVHRASPLPGRQVDFLLKEAKNGLHAVFVGQILTSLIQGAVGGIGFLIAGLPGAIVWAAVMAVLSLLPIVGAFLVWLPASLFLLARGDIWQGFFLLGWGLIVVSQVDNLIRPRLIGNRANIHPIFVLIGVLGGVAAFGFIGLFLGPMIVGLTISVLKVWESHYMEPQPDDPGGPEQTALPTDT